MFIFYPMNFLKPMYIFLYFFWLIREYKAITFWLYLWQLKEYHIGRFLAHFSTSKGKGIFLNTLFLLKLILPAGALAFYSFFAAKIGSASFFSIAPIVFIPHFGDAVYLFSLVIFAIFLLEAANTIFYMLFRRLKQPVATKKTVFLTIITQAAVFIFAICLFKEILGEMAIADFALAAFLLLLFDVLTPAIVSFFVLILQPLAVFERNKIIKKAALKKEQFESLTTVGVSGSYGKSSTKEFLAAILGQKYKVLKTKANQNSEIGVSLAILNDLKPEHEIFVCEIGAYDKGRIKFVGNIVKPKIGILAGINEQHLATFGSQENIIAGKYKILEILPPDGIAILNWDSDFVRSSFESQKGRIKTKNIVFCGTKEKKDVWAEDIKIDKDKLAFKIKTKNGDSEELNLGLFGGQNIEPILLAAAAAKTLGMTLNEIAAACTTFDSSFSGIRKEWGIGGITVVNSTYSSNPDGVLAHLDYLKLWEGKKAIIMPCLIELGSASKEVHKRIGKKIGEVCDLAIVITREHFKEIKSGAISAGMKEENILFLEKNAQIMAKIKAALGAGDVILLEGRLPETLITLIGGR